jgi:hypothetical protein
MENQTQLRWHDSKWQRQARHWIHAEAKRNAIQPTGEIEQPHAYAWSTVMRVSSSEGMPLFSLLYALLQTFIFPSP